MRATSWAGSGLLLTDHTDVSLNTPARCGPPRAVLIRPAQQQAGLYTLNMLHHLLWLAVLCGLQEILAAPPQVPLALANVAAGTYRVHGPCSSGNQLTGLVVCCPTQGPARASFTAGSCISQVCHLTGVSPQLRPGYAASPCPPQLCPPRLT